MITKDWDIGPFNSCDEGLYAISRGLVPYPYYTTVTPDEVLDGEIVESEFTVTDEVLT